MNPYDCPECGMGFTGYFRLKGHIYSDHADKGRKMAKYYKNPLDGKAYRDPAFQQEARTMLPPTDLQKERISQLKDVPEFAPHLDWLIECITKHKMLETRGAAGKLLNDMKEKIKAANGTVPPSRDPGRAGYR